MELIYESHLPFLLRYQFLFQGLADEKYQAEDGGGGLSLSAEPGPGKGPEILLRAKRDPKNAGTIRGSQKFKKIKNQKKTDAWKRKQRNKKENGKQSAKSKTKSKIQLKLLKKKKLKEKKNEVAQTERKKSAPRQCTSATVSEECLTVRFFYNIDIILAHWEYFYLAIVVRPKYLRCTS